MSSNSFKEPTPLSQYQNHHGPLMRLRLRLLSFFKGPLLLNYKRIVVRELLMMAVQDLEDIFSKVSKNYCAWLNIQGLGPNDAGSARRKTHDYIYIHFLFINMKNVCSIYTRMHTHKHIIICIQSRKLTDNVQVGQDLHRNTSVIDCCYYCYGYYFMSWFTY